MSKDGARVRSSGGDGVDHLRADCSRCMGLCCVAPAFSASADFAIDKAAGRPCPNLQPDFRCGIHDRLRRDGFPGCTAFDCFGAGQQVTQVTFAGRDWRNESDPGQMFDAFAAMLLLHELLWYLTEALTLADARSAHAELVAACDTTEGLTRASPETLAALDRDTYARDVGTLLHRTSAVARSAIEGPPADHSGADLAGADLRRDDLRGAGLRGACLIGADLRGVDLTRADLLGADLRSADVSGADLSGSIFVTQSQVAAARGDHETRLPAALDRPSHWLPPAP